MHQLSVYCIIKYMSLSMIPSGELALVHASSGIEPAFEAMVFTPLPGFQIVSAVSTEESLATLQGLMRRFNPGFEFDEVSNEYNSGGTTQPHLDGLYPESFSGLALHENIHGLGTVTLQLVRPNITDDSEINNGDFVGPCLEGALEPGTKTIFSEQIFDEATQQVILGAAYHMFTSNSGNTRRWKRYTYSGIY